MKKLLLIGALIITPSLSYSGLSTGTVLIIDTLEQKNSGEFPIVNAPDVAVSTDNFSGNLGTGDMDLQTALETIDGLSVGGGSGVSVYPATATASFPLGLSASTMTLTGLPGEGVLYIDGSGIVSTAAVSGTGDIEGVNVTAPVTGGGASGTVTIGLQQISLSTGVTGSLADGSLSANVPLLNATQTFSGANTFSGAVSMSSATTMTASTMTYTDVHVVVVGTLTVNGVDVSGGGGGSGDVEEITVTAPITGGGTSGTVNIGIQQISLSTGVTGTLADGSLSSNVPLLNATQTFTGGNTFGGALTVSSGTSIAASTITLTDVDFILTGTMTVNGVEIDGSGGGSGDITAVVAGYGLIGGATSGSATLNLDPDTTSYIQAGETLQSGATFYVSSATVANQFNLYDDDAVAPLTFTRVGKQSAYFDFDDQSEFVTSDYAALFVKMRTGTVAPQFDIIASTQADHSVSDTSGDARISLIARNGDSLASQVNITAGNVGWNIYDAGIEFSGLSGATPEFRFYDVAVSSYVALKASATIANDVTFTLPAADGSSGQALVTDGTGNLSFDTVGGGTQSKSFTITAVTSDGDFGAIWKAPAAITITRINVVQVGATNVVGQLQECNSDGGSCTAVDSSDITATTGNAADDGSLSNASIDANDWIGWSTTSVSGTNTRLSVTFDYTVN